MNQKDKNTSMHIPKNVGKHQCKSRPYGHLKATKRRIILEMWRNHTRIKKNRKAYASRIKDSKLGTLLENAGREVLLLIQILIYHCFIISMVTYFAFVAIFTSLFYPYSINFFCIHNLIRLPLSTSAFFIL